VTQILLALHVAQFRARGVKRQPNAARTWSVEASSQAKYWELTCAGTQQLGITRPSETTGQSFLQVTKATFPTVYLWETVLQHVI